MTQRQLHHSTTYRQLHCRASLQQLVAGFITWGRVPVTLVAFQNFLSLNVVSIHFFPLSGMEPSKFDGTVTPHRHVLT